VENTKAAFLTRYREELIHRYSWAQDADRLERYMESVQRSITGPTATWVADGEALVAVWRAMGNKGKPTLKALRALA
jgi:hypothetical protein